MYEGMGHPGDKQTVVIDIGTAYTKCGFAGESAPRCIVRTEVSFPDLKQTRQVHEYANPEDLHQLLVSFIHGVFFKHLLVSPKDRRVVIVESLLETTLFRDTLAKALFVHFEVLSVMFAPSHLVVPSVLGVQTALVLDVGFKEAVLFPVFEGVPVLHAWQAQPLGAQAWHTSIRAMLSEHAKAQGGDSVVVERLSESVIEDIKVRLCFVRPRGRADDAAPPPAANYRANDVALAVPGSVRERSAEALFRQDADRVSLATMCLDAIAKCSVDARRALAENIVVVGGTAMAPGFVARLAAEIRAAAETPPFRARLAATTKFKFHAAPAKANFTAWLGGSIFGGTELLVSRSLTRESYNKIGSVPDWSRLDQPPPVKQISYGI